MSIGTCRVRMNECGQVGQQLDVMRRPCRRIRIGRITGAMPGRQGAIADAVPGAKGDVIPTLRLGAEPFVSASHAVGRVTVDRDMSHLHLAVQSNSHVRTHAKAD